MPDLFGCVACGDTPHEARAMIREAVALHIELLRQNGKKVRMPQAMTDIGRAA